MSQEYEIRTYSREDMLGFEPHIDEVAMSVVDLLRDNYPNSHNAEQRTSDLSARLDVDSVRSLSLNHNSSFLVAEKVSDQEAAGFAEMRIIPREFDTLAQLTWLVVGKQHRGYGLASKIHNAFLQEAQARHQGRLPLVAQLGVHPDNPAKAIYERWGYVEVGEAATGNLFMMGLVEDMIDI